MATSVPSVPARPFAHLAQSNRASDLPNKDDPSLTTTTRKIQTPTKTMTTPTRTAKRPKKSKKTKKAEDDTDERDDDKPDARAARQREKARIRTIIGSTAGKRLPDAALHLALNGAMPRHAAVKLLKSMAVNVPQGGGSNLRDRMAGVNVDVGAGDAQSQSAPGVSATAAAIIMAGKRRRGEV